MNVSDLSAKEQIEALTDLQQSSGWRLFRDLIMAEISGDFEEHITRALDVPDQVVAIDRMRQVAAIRKAGLRWLKLPAERVKTLEQGEQASQPVRLLSRRPEGV